MIYIYNSPFSRFYIWWGKIAYTHANESTKHFLFKQDYPFDSMKMRDYNRKIGKQINRIYLDRMNSEYFLKNILKYFFAGKFGEWPTRKH